MKTKVESRELIFERDFNAPRELVFKVTADRRSGRMIDSDKIKNDTGESIHFVTNQLR